MQSKRFSFIVLGSFLFLAVSCGGDKAAEAPPADEPAEKKVEGVAPDLSQAGSIAGKVSFEGTAPKGRRIRMDADPVCTKQHSDKVYSQDVIINENGTLSNVFVWIKGGLEQYTFPTPSEQVSLDQKSCFYTPPRYRRSSKAGDRDLQQRSDYSQHPSPTQEQPGVEPVSASPREIADQVLPPR